MKYKSYFHHPKQNETSGDWVRKGMLKFIAGIVLPILVMQLFGSVFNIGNQSNFFFNTEGGFLLTILIWVIVVASVDSLYKFLFPKYKDEDIY